MILPPFLLRIKIEDRERHISLWIPLFLIWIVLGIPALALLLLILLVFMVSWNFDGVRHILKGGLAFYKATCALKDLKIDIDRGKEKLLLYLK